MLFITKHEYETLRIGELENKYYNILIHMFYMRCGKVKDSHKIIEKHHDMTLKEFDSSNNFLAIGELFKIV